MQVNVDTVLVEHDATAKAIVDLIAIHRITNLVIGLKKLPNSRYNYFFCLFSFHNYQFRSKQKKMFNLVNHVKLIILGRNWRKKENDHELHVYKAFSKEIS